ncbi:MAG: cobyrinate a,c-diamide synthase, partial [Chromatiaceae bacterium]
MSRHACPALFLAAPASGQGKTTVTAALARHHRDLGHRVRVFKTGPDFLDPMILERASGAPVYQLDLWMGGEAHCRQLLYQAAGAADLILIEGVMGLFDGDSSSADLATRLGIPILALIDASHMAQTFGALAHGLATYRPGLPFAGVFANRVAGERHYQMLAESLPPGLTALGWLPRDADIALPSRHLGLVQAAQIADLEARLDLAAAALRLTDPALPAAVTFSPVVAPEPVNTFPASADPPSPNPLPPGEGEPCEWLDPDAPSPLGGEGWGEGGGGSSCRTRATSPSQPLAGVRIAVARDAAFAFLYRANLELLTALGAEIAFFSPLADRALPAADALY